MIDPRTFWETVSWRAATTPDALFAIDDTGRELTFAGYRDWCERAAAGLQELGVGPDVRVSWQLPTWFESTVLMGALSRLEAVQNPIIPIYRQREVGFVVRQTQARLLVVPTQWRGFDYLSMAEEIAGGVDGCEVLVCDRSLPEGDPADLPPEPSVPPYPEQYPVRWIYYTSGTTADPKGALHTDWSILAQSRHMWTALELNSDDVWPLIFPFTHIGGSAILQASLVSGAQLCVTDTFDPPVTTRWLSEQGMTVGGSGTAFFLAFLAEQRKQPDTPLFPNLRLCTGGGAAKPVGLHEEVRDELGGVGIISSYGLTECPIITFARIGDPDEALTRTEGRVVAGTRMKLITPDGRLAGVGEEGEIRLNGPSMCRGYLDESLNAEAFDEDGFFRTGDLGTIDSQGHVSITGRLKDIIIRKGENISAKEIEDLLYTHPKVADVAVIGLADPSTGERCCAVVVPTDPAQPLGFAEMQDHCRGAGLMTQKIPEQLEQVDALPRNPAGKVVKFELRDRFGAG